MKKCLDLAILGLKKTKSNPLVGCVITYNGKTISTGYHEKFGAPHAELNAINKIITKYPQDYPEILKKSTLYVNLEPCAHHGKTPPCLDLIIQYQIKKVIIGTKDPFELVNGKSIKKLKKYTQVIVGVMDKECKIINNQYFINNKLKQPKIILKWAVSKDGFINNDKPGMLKISSLESIKLSHKWRSETDAIMVGTNTIKCDNPKLTTRYFLGKNPIRITIDRHNILNSEKWNIFNQDADTIILNESITKKEDNVFYLNYTNQFQNVKSNNLDTLKKIMLLLFQQNIRSIIVEGGNILLQKLIDNNLWDESRIITTNKIIKNGVPEPVIKQKNKYEKYTHCGDDKIIFITNNQRI